MWEDWVEMVVVLVLVLVDGGGWSLWSLRCGGGEAVVVEADMMERQ
jgi:hypothetical protein